MATFNDDIICHILWMIMVTVVWTAWRTLLMKSDRHRFVLLLPAADWMFVFLICQKKVLALGFEPTTNRFTIPRPTTSPILCFHYCLNVLLLVYLSHMNWTMGHTIESIKGLGPSIRHLAATQERRMRRRQKRRWLEVIVARETSTGS
jgi:hypothetical protein